MITNADRLMRTAWFRHDRFGMFIHWGLYSVGARGEWTYSDECIPTDTYQMYFDLFDPEDYDPRAWIQEAKRAGMRYAVMTAKHNDGFCLFDSAYTDYKATNTRAGRDLIREFVDACRAEDFKIGLFYSLIDWHHPDYPHYADKYHPRRNDPAERAMEDTRDFSRYIDYMHKQVRELCTNYGKIDVLWLDFSYDNMVGEKWKAAELVKMVRSLQPDILINNRLEGSSDVLGSISTSHPSPYAGDFACPEQIVPPRVLTDTNGNPIPWEACISLNNHFGYHAHDNVWKEPRLLIRKLVECVSKNGNLLLNVGPDARGNLTKDTLSRLRDIGDWMKKNSASIYGCGSFYLPKPEWGWYTQAGKRLYAHVFDSNIGPLAMEGLRDKVESMRLLTDGSYVPIRTWKGTTQYGDYLFVSFGDYIGERASATYPLPDDRDTVIEIILKE